MIVPQIILPARVKVCLPIGGLQDIPTGEFLPGVHNQMVLNGGQAYITGYVGPGNCFKTTIMRGNQLRGMDRFSVTMKTPFYLSYDTELNAHESRNAILAGRFSYLKDKDILNTGIWAITDKSVYHGNQFFEILKDMIKSKQAKGEVRYKTAFLDRDNVSPMESIGITHGDIDSLSHFSTEDVVNMLDKTEIGESSANTWSMRQGLGKYRLLHELPTLTAAGMHYTSFTAHIGKEISMPSAPGTPPPRKQLQGMREGEIIKGVSNNFFYLLHNCWLINNARPFLNQGSKAPEYPRFQGEEVAGDLDLFKVDMKQLRGKNGQSGFTLTILVSQIEGILHSLTEFHLLRETKQYGLIGNDRSYALAIYPDVKLSRTTVRQTLREDPKLERAVEITSQLLQCQQWLPRIRPQLLEPEDLYTKLIEKGFDWDFILKYTRCYHVFNDDEAPLFPWSTLDLCRAATGDYWPYFLESDGKTVKKEYRHKLGDA